MNKSLANEFGRDGITVNTIATGYIETPRMRAYYEKLAADRGVSADSLITELTANVPARRIGTPEEMAGVIAFLCSATGRLRHRRVHCGRRRIPPERLVSPSVRMNHLRRLEEKI